MAHLRTTFLLCVFGALPALASPSDLTKLQCGSKFDACNRSSVAQSNPDQCIQEFHACLDDVAKAAAGEASTLTQTHGGHSGGYRAGVPEPTPQAVSHSQPATRAMSTSQPTFIRPPRQDQDESQRCPSSSYPYTNEQGKVSCVTSGDIARGMNTAAKGTVENEMMGFFAELSQRKE